MRILGIDASSRILSLAILDNKNEILEYNIDSEKRLSSLIIPTVKDILKKKKIAIDELDAFAVGLGPGSFTGLRIAVATIKALSLATSKPLIGIPSLDILASNASKDSSQICPLVDAKRGKVYSCIYKVDNACIIRKSDYLLVEIKELLEKIKDSTVFLGDGLNIFAEFIKTKLGRRAIFIDDRLWFPRARNLVVLAKEKFIAKKFDNIDKLTPLYLYPKECQIKKIKK